MSRDYEEIAARFWNLPDKGEMEADREIAAHLNGVKTVFDGGAGAGRLFPAACWTRRNRSRQRPAWPTASSLSRGGLPT